MLILKRKSALTIEETNKHLPISYALSMSISNSCRESFSRCWSINQRFLLLLLSSAEDSFRGAVSAAMEMSLRRQADKIDVHRVNNTHKQGLQPFADASLDVKTCLCLLSFLSPPCFLLFFHLPLFFLPPSPFIQRIVQRSVIGIEEERIRKLK